jgi:hypothetical protein
MYLQVACKTDPQFQKLTRAAATVTIERFDSSQAHRTASRGGTNSIIHSKYSHPGLVVYQWPYRKIPFWCTHHKGHKCDGSCVWKSHWLTDWRIVQPFQCFNRFSPRLITVHKWNCGLFCRLGAQCRPLCRYLQQTTRSTQAYALHVL